MIRALFFSSALVWFAVLRVWSVAPSVLCMRSVAPGPLVSVLLDALYWTWFRAILQPRGHIFVTSTQKDHFLTHLPPYRSTKKNNRSNLNVTNFKTPTPTFGRHKFTVPNCFRILPLFWLILLFTNPTVKVVSPGVHSFFISTVVFFGSASVCLRFFWFEPYIMCTVSMLEIIESIFTVMS